MGQVDFRNVLDNVCLREVPKKFHKLFGYTPLAECPPKFASRYAVKALFEIDVDRVHAAF